MSATHGSAFRRIGLSLVMLLALSALFASVASAKPAPITSTQLSLGDSLAFGYSAQLFNENLTTGEAASNFENGYTNDYLKLEKGKLLGQQLVNLGCPGETTESLLGNGPLDKGLQAAKAIPVGDEEAACAYHEVDAEAAGFPAGTHFPLHTEYGLNPETGKGRSQLEAALYQIALNAALGTPVTKVTFNIGANDELHYIAKCEASAKKAAEAAGAKAGEEAYIKALEEGKSAEEAGVIAYEAGKAAGEKYGAEHGVAEVKACIEAGVETLFGGILTNIGVITHVLRDAGTLVGHGAINYTGAIVFQGGYDPYGNVSGTGEILPGSRELAGDLNAHLAGAIAAGGGGSNACVANPLPKFNPGNSHEPPRLQAWTNMANTNVSNGKKDGPDIHPTPTGYRVLANIMKAQCG